VSQDTDLERWEIETATIGLRGAYKRCMDAYRDLIPNQAIAGVSVVEFVFWACALDERLSKADPKYAARRDGDEHGQLLPALRFTRDRTRTRWPSETPGRPQAGLGAALHAGLPQPRSRRDDILAEAAGITPRSWHAWPSTHVGHELIAAGMLIMAGGGNGTPLDYDELERWTRVGYERE
jgi:hypothetical protein